MNFLDFSIESFFALLRIPQMDSHWLSWIIMDKKRLDVDMKKTLDHAFIVSVLCASLGKEQSFISI